MPLLSRLALCLALAGLHQVGFAQLQSDSSANANATLPGAETGGSDAARRGRVVWRIESSVMVSDNLGALSDSDGKDGGLLLRVGPGLSWAHRGGSSRWQLDYSLQAQHYVRTPQQGKPFQNNLRANGSVDLAGPALTFDGQASIAQRTRSAFDVQRTLGESGLGETSEVGTVSAGPTLRLRLGEGWRAVVKHAATVTRARGTMVGDATGQNSQINLEPAAQAVLTWGAALSHQTNRPAESRSTSSTQARLNLNWRPDVDWSVVGHAGRERTDLQSIEAATGSIYGANVSWSPTPRTRAQLSGEHRVIGNFHTLSLDHRFSRASVRFSDTRSVNQTGAVGGVVGTTNYDLLFAQLASQAPDPIERELLVRQRLAELGLAPNSLVANGFLSSQPSISRSRLLGLTYQQARALWTLNLTKSRTSRLFAGGLGSEDLASSSFVDSSSLQGGVTYRLTPMSAVRVQLSWQRNEGEVAAIQRNELRTAVAGWQVRLGPQVQVAVSMRRSQFDSPTRPFTENAVLVNVDQRF